LTGHFSKYAGGLPGIGLLIVRATIGVAVVSQGCGFLLSHDGGLSWLWVFGVVMCLGGSALVLGVLTVLTSLTIGLAQIGIACSFLPSSSPALSQSQTAPLLIAGMAIALALIGPGAFSVDACLFGLREVKIPRNSPPSNL